MICKFDKAVYIRKKLWAIAISAIGLIAMFTTLLSGGEILLFAFETVVFVLPLARIWHYTVGKKNNTVTIYDDAIVIDEGNNDFVVPQRIRVVVQKIDKLSISKNKIEIRGRLNATTYKNDDIGNGQTAVLQGYCFMREYDHDSTICERLTAMERML